jgi:hypothetical protein
MIVNADRKGPKDLLDLAHKAHAYKALLGAKAARDAGNEGAQKGVDDAFERFADLHRNPETGKVDTGEMQATIDYLNKHIQKGKSI